MVLLPVLFVFGVSSGWAAPLASEEVWELQPLVHFQSPLEAWESETDQGALQAVSARALDLGQSLSKEAGAPVLSTGRPGGMVQVRGSGAGSDEVEARTLGIPLNPAQGGGFDLSTFPAWYWSHYRYAEGRTAGMSLDLTPWTARALDEDSQQRGRLHAQGDTLGVYEVAASLKGSRRSPWALQIGTAQGATQGWTAGMSAQVLARAKASTRVHLLATDRLVQDDGGGMNPGGTQHSRRVLPVVQQLVRSGSRQIQFAGFIDWGDTTYRSPSIGTEMRSQTSQLGAQVLAQDRHSGWQWLGSARHVAFMIDGQRPPEETWAGLRLAKGLAQEDRAGLEPSIGLDWLDTLGFLPQAALAYRHSDSQASGWSATLRYSQKAPTLVDRFFDWGTFFQGNRALRPEHSIKAIAAIRGATERQEGQWRLEAYLEGRLDSQVLNGTRVDNLGQGYIAGLETQSSWTWLEGWTLTGNIRATASRVTQLGLSYPYLPALASRWSQGFAPWGDRGAAFELGYETSESVQILGVTPSVLPGWGTFDLTVTLPLARTSALELGVQNLMGESFQKVQGYPLGRSAVLAWNATF